MPERGPTTETAAIAEMKRRLDDLLDEVGRDDRRVLVERDGVPIGALVSAEDLHRLTRLDREREARFAVIDRMRAAFRDVPVEEIERETARAVAEVRAEMAAERESSAYPAA